MKILQSLLSFTLLVPSVMLATENPFKPCEERLCRSEYERATVCFNRMYDAQGGSTTDAFRIRALVNWGESLLGEGNYAEGWKYRDARLEMYQVKLARPWDGSNPAGKTILVRCEGGLGDTFFFDRYVSFLNDLGAKVILLVQGPLKPIMKQSKFNGTVLTGKDFEATPMAFDYDVYMMSLPRYLSHDRVNNTVALKTTTLNSIPTIGQYMFADSTLVAQWKAKLPADKFKIGICWKASPLPGGVTRMLERDIPLKLLAAIGDIEGVKLYNLLSGYDEPVRVSNATAKTDPKNIVADNACTITSFDSTFDKAGPFMDTAAVMENMDLIISVDTSVPNLAGALFRPTWVLLAYESDWRWGNERNSTSPWHPTVRTFWQPNQGNWAPVMEQVVAALKQEVAAWKQRSR